VELEAMPSGHTHWKIAVIEAGVIDSSLTSDLIADEVVSGA
jgi:hypothetical protein